MNAKIVKQPKRLSYIYVYELGQIIYVNLLWYFHLEVNVLNTEALPMLLFHCNRINLLKFRSKKGNFNNFEENGKEWNIFILTKRIFLKIYSFGTTIKLKCTQCSLQFFRLQVHKHFDKISEMTEQLFYHFFFLQFIVST